MTLDFALDVVKLFVISAILSAIIIAGAIGWVSRKLKSEWKHVEVDDPKKIARWIFEIHTCIHKRQSP